MHIRQSRINLAGNGQDSPPLAPLLFTRRAEVAELAIDAILASLCVGKRTGLAAAHVVSCRSHGWKLSGTKLWMPLLLSLLSLLLLRQWGQLNQPVAKTQDLLP